MERAISPSLLNLIFALNSELLFCMSAFVFLYYLHFFFIYLFFFFDNLLGLAKMIEDKDVIINTYIFF